VVRKTRNVKPNFEPKLGKKIHGHSRTFSLVNGRRKGRPGFDC
jgi:hypothetical protein